ncbi:unnamed protein product [Rhizoctonia solani]|uniref:Uncharacterized protein n=1 Tax=Rhizoctonia solani TaxID=456999 RepID=A0A8H3BBY9_9AGAM|nr:unnamed protein product [Rhizoctonia solani]CAE6452738.1 unnamed protein product [Rhizoctonia solani]
MALTFYAVLFFQIIEWVYAERIPSTSGAPIASTYPILEGPNTSLKPLTPIIVGSALGGFLGFLVIIFGGLYLLRRRRSKDVDTVVEGAHFPTVGYNSSPSTASPPISASSQSHYGYSYWEKAGQSAPTVPPGLPIPPIRS